MEKIFAEISSAFYKPELDYYFVLRKLGTQILTIRDGMYILRNLSTV